MEVDGGLGEKGVGHDGEPLDCRSLNETIPTGHSNFSEHEIARKVVDGQLTQRGPEFTTLLTFEVFLCNDDS